MSEPLMTPPTQETLIERAGRLAVEAAVASLRAEQAETPELAEAARMARQRAELATLEAAGDALWNTPAGWGEELDEDVWQGLYISFEELAEEAPWLLPERSEAFRYHTPAETEAELQAGREIRAAA